MHEKLLAGLLLLGGGVICFGQAAGTIDGTV